MEIGIPQPAPGDAIQRRSWDDAAERARRAEAAIVGHDEQHVGRAFRRHDARGPPRFRVRGFLLNYSTEFRIGRRKLFAVKSGGGARLAERPSNLLGLKRSGHGISAQVWMLPRKICSSNFIVLILLVEIQLIFI